MRTRTKVKITAKKRRRAEDKKETLWEKELNNFTHPDPNWIKQEECETECVDITVSVSMFVPKGTKLITHGGGIPDTLLINGRTYKPDLILYSPAYKKNGEEKINFDNFRPNKIKGCDNGNIHRQEIEPAE